MSWTNQMLNDVLGSDIFIGEFELRDIAKSPDVTLEMIFNNDHREWDWDYVSYNPNITWKIIKEYIYNKYK